ncbi:MAG TPA: hypothetical protein DCO77_04455 [Nitrospiraceae bacterium]|nr:hypothetical protein [Nitrospiraceae bacterium]
MTAQRMVYLMTATVVGAGIWHTGFDRASWILYIPVGVLFFAGVSGICLGLIFWRAFGFK